MVYVAAVGAPAIGKLFFNRDEEIKNIRKSIDTNNVLIVAPRRFGKTSVMRKIENMLIKEGFVCFFIDVMSLRTPKDFLIKITNESLLDSKKDVIDKITDALKDVFSNIKEIGASAKGEIRVIFREKMREDITENNWMSKGEEIFKIIIESYGDKPVFFIIDEMSEFILNMIKTDVDLTRTYLQWFRGIRQKWPKNIRFMIGGSICFERVVKIIDGYSYINDFQPISIGGFSEANALKFIKKIIEEEGFEYNDEVGKEILRCIGEVYIPYFIAGFLSIIIQKCPENITKEDVIEIYDNDMLGDYGRSFFQYYKLRLKTHYEEYSRVVENILKEISKAEKGYPKDLGFNIFRDLTGKTNESDYNELLLDLENDFYIIINKGNLYFYSKVLKDWWKYYE